MAQALLGVHVLALQVEARWYYSWCKASSFISAIILYLQRCRYGRKSSKILRVRKFLKWFNIEHGLTQSCRSRSHIIKWFRLYLPKPGLKPKEIYCGCVDFCVIFFFRNRSL
jgi:hypothetical protein